MVARKGQEEHRSGHGPLVPVPGFRPSQARWANEPDGRAVVFVHGFNGKAVGTWKGFETLLPQRPEAVGTDLLFYGYDTFRDSTPLASQKLRELLDQLSLIHI